MSFLTAKIPQALADRLGANAADFSDKLTALLDMHAAELATAKASAKPVEPDAALVSRLEAVETQLAAFKAAPAVDRDALVKECKDAAAAETAQKLSAVLAKNGGKEIAAPTVPANESGEGNNLSAEERWKADTKLQAEFSSAEVFAAYEKATAQGRVRIQGRAK